MKNTTSRTKIFDYFLNVKIKSNIWIYKKVGDDSKNEEYQFKKYLTYKIYSRYDEYM